MEHFLFLERRLQISCKHFSLASRSEEGHFLTCSYPRQVIQYADNKSRNLSESRDFHGLECHYGETERSLGIRLKEQERCTRLEYVQSAVAEHQLTTGYKILFEKTFVLAKKNKGYLPKKYRKGTEITRHLEYINRDTGFYLHPIQRTFRSFLFQLISRPIKNAVSRSSNLKIDIASIIRPQLSTECHSRYHFGTSRPRKALDTPS